MIFSNLKSLTIPECGVSRITSGGVTLWEKSGLPSGCRKVKYLQSDGKQHIDTGIVGKSGIKSFIDFEYITGSMSDYIVFGCSHGNNRGAWSDRFYPASARDGKWVLGYGDRLYAEVAPSFNKRYEVESELFVGKQTMKVNGETVISGTLTTTINKNWNMYLFGVNYIGTVKYYGGCRIYSCWIESDGVLVRDFIPILDADNKPCLYDKVSGEFFYNKGTGNFTYSY
jgi:hypothetical protein